MYKVVDTMLGGLTKVTPSSKMVGDMAIFIVQNDLTPENILEKGQSLTFPDSVIAYFKGMMGQPPHGFPKDLQEIVLKGEKPITCRPEIILGTCQLEKAKKKLKSYAHTILICVKLFPIPFIQKSPKRLLGTRKRIWLSNSNGKSCLLQWSSIR